MWSRPLKIFGVSILAALCIVPTAEALTIVPFQSMETGTYLFTFTSPTTNHAVATGTGTSTLGSFQASGSEDSDFTDPLHQTVTNGHFTQDYGGGNTLFGTFSGTATATSSTGGTVTLSVPFIAGTGALTEVIGGTGTATGMFQFVSTNPDQTENFTYALSLTANLEVVPEPPTPVLLTSALAALGLVWLRSGPHAAAADPRPWSTSRMPAMIRLRSGKTWLSRTGL